MASVSASVCTLPKQRFDSNKRREAQTKDARSHCCPLQIPLNNWLQTVEQLTAWHQTLCDARLLSDEKNAIKVSKQTSTFIRLRFWALIPRFRFVACPLG